MQKTYLFIHGAWHGKWCWQNLIEILNKKGIKAYAIDLPGHGTKSLITNVILSDYVDYCLSFIKEKDMKNIILVGHSFAGIVISKLAEQIPERINKLIYLASIVLNKESFLDVIPKEIADNFKKQHEESEDDCLRLPDQMVHGMFLSSLAPGDKRIDYVIKNLTPQPFKPFSEKVFYKDSNIPRIFISCKKDPAVHPELVKKALSILKCKEISLDSDHDIMITNPQLLADALIEN
jgi:pimeloyl-ACP methyl ester carboxylesterase